MPRRPSLLVQTRQRMLQMLSDGTYDVGDKLPAEQELATLLNVSRATVREACGGLIDAGYILRRQGIGTFVQRSPNQKTLDATLSYVSIIEDAGSTAGILVIGCEPREATDEEIKRLHLEVSDTVTVVERVHTSDGTPVVYSLDRIPTHIGGRIFLDSASMSLFDYLEQIGSPPRTARARLTPVLAGQKIAKALRVHPSDPLLYIDETDYDWTGRPVMISEEWHVGNSFPLWLNRRVSDA